MLKKIISVFRDSFYILQSRFFSYKETGDYSFAFLVHARGYKDIYRQFPFFKHLPKSFVLWFMETLWPITLSEVTGLKSVDGTHEVKGFVLGITMTAEQMMQKRKKALKKIRQAVHLASGKGVRIVGLGGLTSSLSGGGLELLDLPVHLTTGHAYTAYNVTANVFKITDMFGVPKEDIVVGVVGSAGSIGSMSAELIAERKYKELILIDIPRKMDTVTSLAKTLQDTHGGLVSTSDNLGDVSRCDIIVTATNTPEALITRELVRPGQVYIDDAQPSDIDHEVLTMPDVLVLEAGVVHTPHIQSNFHYGLKHKTDNFCCMAELLILASNMWDNHYVVHRATREHVRDIARMGEHLGFTVASFQNFLESISSEKLAHVKQIFQHNHGVSS